MILDRIKIALGLAFFLLTTILFQYESRFDSFFPDANTIYRIEEHLLLHDGSRFRQAVSPFPEIDSLERDFEEIESAVRISLPIPKSVLVFGNRQKTAVRDGIWADPNFFTVFQLPFIHGQAETALSRSDSLVLSEKVASLMFGEINPVGQTVIFNNVTRCRVTGVFENLPKNSHFHFSYVLSKDVLGKSENESDSGRVFTYIRLGKGSRPGALKERLRILLEDTGSMEKELILKPLKNIHLGGNGYSEFEPNKKKSTFLFMLSIAAFLLLLSTLKKQNRSPTKRYKAAKKNDEKTRASSSPKKNLNRLLIGSLKSSLLSTAPAVILSLLLLPGFRRVLGIEFSVISLPAFGFAVFVSIILVTLSLFIQNGISTKRIVDGKTKHSFFSHAWKKTLIFLTAVTLLIFLINSYGRYNQLKQEQPGFDQNSIIIVPFPSSNPEALNRGAALKADLLRHPHIAKASFSLNIPFDHYASVLVSLDGQARTVPVHVSYSDADIVDTYGMLVVDGQKRAFAPEDSKGEIRCVINQSAAALLNPGIPTESSLVGQRIVFNDTRKPVISAVVKDFPFYPGRSDSSPLVMIINPSVYPYLSLRISEMDRVNTLEFVESRYNLLFPRDVFDYQTLRNGYKILTEPVRSMTGFFLLALMTAASLFLLNLSTPIRKLFNSSLLYWIIYYAGILVIVKPHLLYAGFGRMLEVPEFSTGSIFLAEKFFQVGGAVTLLANLLAQFFINSWLGAGIVTAIAWGLTRLTSSMILRFTKRKSAVLPYIPALLLLFIFNKYDFPLSLSIALLAAMCLSALYAGIRIKGGAPRSALFLLLFIAGYLMAGGASLLFAGLAFLYEVFKQKKFLTGGIIAASAAVIPYLTGTLMIGLTSKDSFMRLTPFNNPGEESILPAILLLISPPAAILFGWLWMRISGLKKRTDNGKEAEGATGANKQKTVFIRSSRLFFTSLLPAILLSLLFAASLLLSLDATKKTLLSMMYQARKSRWEKVLSWAERLPQGTYSLYANYEINRSLYHAGHLLDTMFDYPQLPEATVLIASEGERFVIQDITISETTMEMGALNIAKHLNLELMEVAGLHPDYLWNLAQIVLAQNHFKTGRIFLNALSRDWIHGNKARILLEKMKSDPELLDHPTIRALREMRLRDDVANISVQEMLEQLVEINPLNRMAFEFLMARYLLDRNVEKIVENIPLLRELGYRDIPRHIEEAILLYQNKFETQVNLLGMKIRPVTAARFQRFGEAISSPDLQSDDNVREAFIRDFAKSYSFYYVFDTTGVQR